MVRNEFDNHQDLHTSAWYLTIATSTTFGFWLDCISAAFVACVTLSFLILDDDIKPPPSWPADGAIQFDRMTMRYSPTDPPVLKDLSFTIQPAQKVGIVGRTGAGKSSLISALFRLTKLEGAIKVDGVDTQKVALHTLRSRISIIPQEPVLFSASLRYNLDPFNEYGDNGMWSALQEVQLNEAVDSLEFEVNEGGSNLSAGQRQLVCLARAIVRNNKILVLDEATANVDPQTDALIQGTIRTKFEGCTVLTIAHRLNTVMDSDMILVMEAGSLVEFDHPHILLQNEDGYFYKMVQETGNHMAEQLHKIAKEAYNSNSIKGTASVEEVSEET